MKTILWFSCLLWLVPSIAQGQEWTAQSDRSHKIASRYKTLVIKKPRRGPLFEMWVKKLGPRGVDRTIESLRKSDVSNEKIVLALLLGELGKHDEQRKILDDVIAISPTTFALLARVDALLLLGETDLAVVDLETAVATTSDKTAKRRAMRLAIDTLLQADRPSRALFFLEQLATLEPKNVRLQRELVDVLIADGQLERALTFYDNLIRRAGKNGKLRAELYRDQGDLFAKINRWQDALRCYDKARSMAQNGSWFRREIDHRLVRLHRQLGTLHSFYPVLKKRWKRTNKDLVALAQIALEVGNQEDGKKLLARVWKRDRKQSDAAQMLIKLHENEGALDKAESTYRELVAARSKDASVRADYARWLFFVKKDSDSARKELAHARKLGTQPNADIIAAETLLGWGLHMDALSILQGLETTHPDDPLHIEVYGTLLAKLGRHDEAVKVWRRLTTDLTGWIRLGELCAANGREKEATEAFEHVLKKRANNMSITRSLAELYEADSRFEEASSLWSRVYDVTRDRAAISKLIYLARYRVDAKSDFATRFEKQPHWGLVVASNAFDRDDFRSGTTALQQTIQRTLASGTQKDRLTASIAVRMMAQSYDALPRPEMASLWWERLARNFSEHRATAYRNAVKSSVMLGERKAGPLLERAAKFVPYDASVHAERAFRAASKKDLKSAVTHIQRAIERRPSELDYRFELAFYLLELGYVDKARDTYAEIVAWDRTGQDGIDAAFNAIDLCETPSQLQKLEKQFRELEHRIPKEAFLTIMLDVYDFVFFDMADQKLAERVAADASRILAMTLHSKYVDERSNALRILALFDNDTVWRAIFKAAEKDGGELPLAILARAQYKRAVPLFEKARKSEDPKTRRIGWFGMLSNPTTAVITELAQKSLAGSREDRIFSAWALGELKQDRALLTAWQSEQDDAVRQVLLWSLAKVGAHSILRSEMKSSDNVRADAAISLLASVEKGDARAVLFDALWSDESPHRQRLKRSLSRNTAPLGDSIWAEENERNHTAPDPYLLVLGRLDEIVETEREERAFAWNYEHYKKEVLAVAKRRLLQTTTRSLVLSDLVEVAYEEFRRPDKKSSYREPVTGVMAALRPELKKIASTAGTARFEACEALPFAGKTEDIGFLVEQLPYAKTQLEISRVLKPLGFYPRSKIVPVIENILAGNDESLHAAAMMTLSQIDGLEPKQRTRFARLIEGFVDTGGAVSVIAIETLGTLRDDASLPILAQAFKSGDSTRRRKILTIVRRFESQNARVLHRKLTLLSVTPPCSGGGEDLPKLLEGKCDNLYGIED